MKILTLTGPGFTVGIVLLGDQWLLDGGKDTAVRMRRRAAFPKVALGTAERPGSRRRVGYERGGVGQPRITTERPPRRLELVRCCGEHHDFPLIIESRQVVLVGASASHANPIILAEVLETGLGRVHIHSERDLEGFIFGHTDKIELLRPHVGHQNGACISVNLEHAAFDRYPLACLLAFGGTHRNSSEGQHQGYRRSNTSVC